MKYSSKVGNSIKRAFNYLSILRCYFKSFYVRYEDDGKPREVQYHILRELDYSTQGKEGRDESQEYIDLTIEQKMKPLLLQLQKSFMTYDLRNVTKLGMYATRIYEFLKQYEVIGNRTFEIEEMKRMFELEKEYPRFPNFFQKVIQPAVKEINKLRNDKPKPKQTEFLVTPLSINLQKKRNHLKKQPLSKLLNFHRLNQIDCLGFFMRKSSKI